MEKQQGFRKYKSILLTAIYAALFLTADLVIGSIFLYSTHKQRFGMEEQQLLANENRSYNNYFDHGLIPNTSVQYIWGNQKYPLFVNSLGMLDKSERKVPMRSDKYRILFIGDSFTEGVGYPYTETFVGLLEKKADHNHIEFLNAGDQSYSPKIYYTKMKYLLENAGLSLDEVVILIDISDIQNEVDIYKKFTPRFDQPFTATPFTHEVNAKEKIKNYLYDHSMVVHTAMNVISRFTQNSTPEEKDPIDVTAPMWTYDKKIYKLFGEEGLALCRLYMAQLVQLLRAHYIGNISIVVYPWPEQIAHDSKESLQVTFWRNFSQQYGVNFINLFPVFFDTSSKKDLFIPGDVHWNADGHQLVAEEMYHSLGIATKSGVLKSAGN